MENAVCVCNWSQQDREVLFESIKGRVDRKDTKVCINQSLLDRFQRLHPQQPNGKHKGLTLSDAVNTGLLIYLKVYEEEE